MERGFLVLVEVVRLLLLHFWLFVLCLQIYCSDSQVLLVRLRSTLPQVHSK